MTAAEWDTRCDLAALYRVLHQFGWTDLIYNHLSARVPDEPGAFLINHYGEMFVLHNHGLLALGATIPETFTRMYYFEHACQVEGAIRALNEEPLPIAETIVAEAGPRKLKRRAEGSFGGREWTSVLRMLDRKGIVFRV